MIVQDLGLIEYGKALALQEETRNLVSEYETQDTLLVCEHPEVITVGRAIGSEEDVLDSSTPLFEVSRGGRSTLHLPGQIVVYPIVDLRERGKDLHGYIRLLESAIINTLGDFRISARRISGKTGVWVGPEEAPRKVASIGIAVKKWVTYHGLALNVTCDLKAFAKINPCGFSSDVMTSVDKELNESYKKVWALNNDSLNKKIKTRLIENIQAILEGEEVECDLG